MTDLRNFILARCDSMNSGFVDCDTAITGVFDVTVEIIGVGEVEMSNNNLINNFNTPFIDERFGGIDLPFEVKSGNFSHWEVVASTAYTYDPNIDTLVIDLQDDVIIRAYFGETKDIVYEVIPPGTTTSININGSIINVFPYMDSPLVDENVTLVPVIDPNYGFEYWDSDSSVILPSTLNESVSFDVVGHDTIKLNLYQKPTIVYTVNPAGTNTSITINGVNINTFPYSTNVFIDDLNTLSPNIDPDYSFASWTTNFNSMLNGGAMNNSFFTGFIVTQ